MRKLLGFLAVWLLLLQSSMAFQPTDWVYCNYPYCYDSASGDWYWFNTEDAFWVCNMGNSEWMSFSQSGLASGWFYPNNAYAYAIEGLSWYYMNPDDTPWVVNLRTGTWSIFGQLSGGDINFPTGGNLAAFNDFDGDGAADLAVYQPAGGNWYVSKLEGGDPIAWGYQLGGTDSVAVPADYNGDGRTDFAVYNTTSGDWTIKTLEGDTLVDGFNLGVRGGVPVPGDYDGDGNADVGVYELDSGDWTVWSFAKGEALYDGFNWGFAGDVRVWENPPTSTVLPMPYDFDQDGATDLGIYYRGTNMPSTVWYILGSSGTSWVPTEHWGSSGSIPAPGLYRSVVDSSSYPAGITSYKIRETVGVGDDGTFNTPYMYQFKIGTYARTLAVPGCDFDANGWDDHTVYDYTTGYWTISFNDGDGNANQEGTEYQESPTSEIQFGFEGAVPANIYSTIYELCGYSLTPW
jgi:hypothetical protein